MTRVVITQPTYLPWLGYFEQMARADVFILLDSVQFTPRSWQSRNRLKGTNGKPFWLTVPVQAHGRNTLIQEIEIARGAKKWNLKHLRSIQSVLARCKHFRQVESVVTDILADPPHRLVDLNIALIRRLASELHLTPTFLRSSELPSRGRKSELLLELCRHVRATTYYSAAGASDYMRPVLNRFAQEGITVRFQDWPYPLYRQRGSAFVPFLSTLDALANIGAAETRACLQRDKTEAAPDNGSNVIVDREGLNP